MKTNKRKIIYLTITDLQNKTIYHTISLDYDMVKTEKSTKAFIKDFLDNDRTGENVNSACSHWYEWKVVETIGGTRTKEKGKYKDIFKYENVSTSENDPVYEITVLDNNDTFLQDFGDFITPADMARVAEFITTGEYKEE